MTTTRLLEIAENVLRGSRTGDDKVVLFTDEAKAIAAELDRLRAENARLEALFQKTHGVHSSWVAEVGRLAEELTNAKATIEVQKAEVARLRELALDVVSAWDDDLATGGADDGSAEVALEGAIDDLRESIGVK